MTALPRFLLALAAACALPATAGLGQPAGPATAGAIVQPAATPQGAAYTRVQRTLDTGTVVTEFVDAGGTVFAVAWSGPFLPDLRALLGPSFDRLATAGTGRGRTSALSINRPDLMLVSAGHMGAFDGRAWLPPKLPAGFDTRQIP
ncbi:DUF2844 domain-containing protein [Ramlibacter sp. CrO1]|uniref:DUF2844 domain-containing protein n=1 Tax=Ramlibacter algicola TaxID=2795217 RepID=A0A934Q2F2_9BURK|nr:DUF2844 domain-containing protein [Ramlibacter algicola]